MPWTEKTPAGLYRAVWRDAQGRQRSKSGYTQQAEALRYAGTQESNARGGKASYQGRSMTWGQWRPLWLELRLVESSTEASDLTRLDRWVESQWGKVPLAKIEADDVQRWVNGLSKQMAPASVAKVYRLLSSSLKAAVKAKKLTVSPCVDIELPPVPPGGERFLTRGEVDAVLFRLDEPYKAAATLLVGTGMRFGEMAGLHWHRLDEMSGTVDVIETFDGDMIKAYPKGRKQRRVPVPSWVFEALPANDGAKTCGLEHARGSRCRSGLVFTGPRGAPLDHRNMIRRHWAPAMARAGLDPARQHDLRHSYASWLIQAGRSMSEIAAVLGHSETAVTARYAHLAGTHMDAVRSVMDGMGPIQPAPLMPHDLGSEATG